jgi:hypothetical protein
VLRAGARLGYRRRDGVIKHCPNSACAGLERDGVVAEFRASVEACLDCGSSLVLGERPAPTPNEVEYLELATIFIASDLSQGHVVAGAIEASGIPVFVKGEHLQGAVGELPPAVGQVEVQVPIERVEAARKIAMIWEGPVTTEGEGVDRLGAERSVADVNWLAAQAIEDEDEPG